MFDTPKEKISKWLKKKIEDSEKAVDHGWEIMGLDDGGMVIDTDQMPFKIIVRVEDDLTYIAVMTNIHTAGQPMDNTEPVFRELLRKNKTMGMTKFFLMDEEDTLCLRTDLFTQYMNKEEFNRALEETILGGRWLIAQLGESEDANRIAKEMAELGSAELLKGTAPEDVSAKMVEAGYSQEQAKALVDNLMVQLGMKEKAQEEVVAKQAEEDTSAVDNYIW